MKFRLHWLTGDKEIITGSDITDAVNRAGIGSGALPALDYWEPIDEAEDATATD